MTFHIIERGVLGSVESVARWGHGRNEAASNCYRGEPGFLVSNDGDEHYTAWRIDADVRRAAAFIGRLEIGEGRDTLYVARLYTQGGDNTVAIEPAPEGFGRVVVDDEGEVVEVIYDAAEIAAAHPDVVAWG
jgi:hypothetical protein